MDAEENTCRFKKEACCWSEEVPPVRDEDTATFRKTNQVGSVVFADWALRLLLFSSNFVSSCGAQRKINELQYSIPSKETFEELRDDGSC